MSDLAATPDHSGALYPEWRERQKFATMYQLVCSIRDRFRDRPAVTFQLQSDPKSPCETLSYKKLSAKIIQAANLFRDLGIGKDDTVAMILPNTNETIVTYFGAMIAGKVAPINPLLEPEQIAALLREVDAKVVVCLRSFPKTDIAQKVHHAVGYAPNVKHVLEVDLGRYLSGAKKQIVKFLRPKVDSRHHAKVQSFNRALEKQQGNEITFADDTQDRVVSLFHTGGPTGAPKVAQHTASGITYLSWPLINDSVMAESDTVMCPLPLFHVLASHIVLNCTLQSGGHFVGITPSGYRGEGVFDNFWHLVERHKVSAIVMVPTAASALLDRKIDADISSLRLAISGSAPLPVEIFNRFQDVTGMTILEGYGMTETTGLNTLNPINGIRKPGSVGRPLELTDVKVLQIDETGNVIRECCQNEIGEICISAPGVLVGKTYLESEKNKGLYVLDRFLRSGDLGRFDEDGFLWITGRAKDLIIRGGHNIDPGMIEDAVLSHSAVALAAAIGQPDRHSGELPCVYVTLVQGKSTTSKELLEFASKHIHERAAVPKHLEIIEEMPVTGVGKIFKPTLRKLATRRAFESALKEDQINCDVVDIVDDPKHGLLVQIAGAPGTEEKAKNCLGGFSTSWQWQSR